jgi:hypothetical protein
MAETSMPKFDPFKSFAQLGANDAWRKNASEQVEKFWVQQKKLLSEFETFSHQLLERRRVATDAALDMARRLAGCKDPTEWTKCCNDWMVGSMARMADDSRDLMQEGMKVVSELSKSMNADMSAIVEATRAANAEPAEKAKR